MRIKNLTPFPFGPKLTARRPPQRELSLAVRGAFALRPGEPLVAFEELLEQRPLSGETFAPDDDERRGEAFYPGDFADFKLRGEVLLRGSCHTPGGRPMKECPVRFSVGAWSKMLRVVGPRAWTDGLFQSATEPQPFSTMPLTYANAFGGPGYAANPVGKGHGGMELPSVEAPGAPVRGRGDRLEPASFGPLSSTWPQRAGKLGKEYGAAWRKTRAPFYAEDFDWSHFNAAPADQRLDGYLRGDEEVTLQNLHPTAPSLSVRLPALRLRAFVKDDRGEIRALTMVLDTLFVAPDDGRVLLTWRGQTPVREDDLADVATLLIASEPLGEEPLPEAHYRQLMEAFEADPVGFDAHIDKHLPAHLRESAREVLRGGSPVPAGPPAGTPPARAVAQMLTTTGGVDHEQAGVIQAGIEKAIAKAGPQADLGGVLSRGLAGPRGGGAPLVAGLPKVPLAEALKGVSGTLEKLKRATAGNSSAQPSLDRLEAMLADPRLRQMDPGVAPPGEPPAAPPPEPGPGVDCAGRDLSHQDLSGRDLTGANLRGANLNGTKLREARLTGANLAMASLSKADLDGAVLDGADLTRANLTGATARGASLRGATLDGSFFRKTILAGAVLDGARASTTLFTEIDATGLVARGVRFYKAVFQRSTLDGADLTEAELTECYFLDCPARGLVARGAVIPRSSFAGSDLTGAKLEGLRGDRTIWRGSKLDGADLSLAVLPGAFFIGATGTATRLFGANLKGARFYRARIEQADLTRANLMGADFCKAQLTGARFLDANLYDARFLGSAGTGTDFTGANLKRAIFEQA